MKTELYSKPFKKYPSIISFLILPFHPSSIKTSFSFIFTAWKSFVVIQNKQKFHITRKNVVNVEHPLDEKIPFVPSNVKIYMDFVWLFCRIMAMFIVKKGITEGVRLNKKIIRFIEGLYIRGSHIYNHALSTTKRPHYMKMFKFVVIHLFDPHLLCVPSLHVAIVVGVWAKVREILSETSFSEEEKSQILDDIYYGSIAITESVLFVKQHSINCVAGALYMLTASHDKGFFTEEDAKHVINSLFLEPEYIKDGNEIQIREYIGKMYKNLIESSRNSTDWETALYNWLDTYKNT